MTAHRSILDNYDQKHIKTSACLWLRCTNYQEYMGVEYGEGTQPLVN